MKSTITRSLNGSIPSVIRSFHKPSAAEQVMHEAVERNRFSITKSEVPLIARPGFAIPPVSREAPGAGFPEHFSLNLFFLRAGNACGVSVFKSYIGAQCRTESAQSSHGGLRFRRIGMFLLRHLARDLGDKAAHAESFRMMRIEQFHGADFLFADDAGNAGEGKLQFFRLRRGRQEQASLGRTRARRFGGEMNFHNGCSRRMRVQIELQELQKNLGIEYGEGKRKLADEFCLETAAE